jgi:16S rRNA (uracil1498-N3)-methyltransferase
MKSRAMRRFTIAPDRYRDGIVTFDRDETRHLARVLRLGPGDTVVASDGRGHDYTVRLETVGEAATGTVLGVTVRDDEPRLRVTLVQGIPKGDKMEAIVRAATELGVWRVWPAQAERTVIRLEPARWRERARRWQRVAREATKQCRRAVVPEIEMPLPLLELIARPAACTGSLRLCLWEGDAPPLSGVLDQRPAPADAFVLVGPEGGLAPGEVDAVRSAGWTVASLGPRILRTETVAPALLAILQFRFGDFARE